MSTIDSRIVTMKFDNSSFKTGVTSTLDLLSKLKLAITGLGTSKSLGSIDSSKATNGLAGVSQAADGISSRFSAMQVVAVAALATIAHAATQSAMSMVKNFTFGPLMDGLTEYQTNLQSIQTIQANTDRPLTEINRSLDELNKYSDQTIYNFAEMARNIGTFTAAGVELKQATSAIKGIANMAALSGSTSQQAAGAMYQLSQAIASGRVSLMDWNSVVNAGMGGKKLQLALAETAVAMGTLEKDAVKGTGALEQLTIRGESFRTSISADAGGETWFTSKVLENTLAGLDGRFSELALSTEKTANGLLKYSKAEVEAKIQASRLAMEQKNGVKYTDEQFKALMKLSDSSFLAATQVKTLGQVFDVAKETMASGWAATFRSIFGDFAEAKKTFTNLSNYINDGINAMSLARNRVFAKWNELGGRTAVIKGIKNAFQALLAVLRPIGQAFREVFPARTAKDLYNYSKAFQNFTKSLMPSKSTVDGIREVFHALFLIISEVLKVGMALIDYFIIDMIALLSGGTGGVMDLIGGFAHLISTVLEFLDIGDRLNAFFDGASAGREALLGPLISGLGAVLSIVGRIIGTGADVVFETLSTVFKAMAPPLRVVGEALGAFGSFLEGRVLDALDRFGGYMESLTPSIEKAGEVVEDKLLAALDKLGPMLITVKDAIVAAAGVIQTYLIAGFEKLQPVIETVREAIGDLLDYLAGVGDRLMDSFGGLSGIGGSFGGLTSMFDVGDSADRAASGIEKIKDALSGFGDSASEGAQSGLSAFGSALLDFGSFVLKIAGAIVLGIGWLGREIFTAFEETFGEGGLLSGIGGFVGNIFSSIAEAFSNVSYGEVMLALNTAIMAMIGGGIGRSVWHIGGIFKELHTMLGGIGDVFTSISNGIDDVAGAAKNEARAKLILNMGIALGILAASVWVLSKIDGDGLARGMSAVAGMLLMMSAALMVLQKSIPDDATIKTAVQMAAMSAVILALSIAMLGMATALHIIAKLSWEEIAKGLITIGVVLGALVGAVYALNKSGGTKGLMAAATSIVILSFALVALAGAIKLYSKLDTGMLAEGGAKIAGLLLVLGLAFRAFPTAGALTAAAGMLVISGAMVIMAKALQMIAELDSGDSWQSILTLAGALLVLVVAANAMTSALAGAAAMLVMAVAIRMLVPAIIQLGEADFGDVMKGIGGLAIALLLLVAAGAALLYSGAIVGLLGLGAAVLLLGAGMALAGIGMVAFATGLAALVSMGSAAVEVLIQVINRFLEAIPGFISRLGDSLVAVAKQIQKAGPEFVKAAGVIMRSFLRETLKTIPLIGKVARAMITEFLKTVRATIPEMIRTAFAIINAFLEGLNQNIGKITNKGIDIVLKLIEGIRKRIDELVKAGADLIIKLVQGIAKEIWQRATSLYHEAKYIGINIWQGVRAGINEGLGWVTEAAANLGKSAIKAAWNVIKPGSPSRVFTALFETVPAGMVKGMDSGSDDVERSARNIAETAYTAISKTMSGITEALELDPNMSPVVTPVLDLSQVADEASRISGLLSAQPLSADVSYEAASALAAEQEAAAASAAEGGEGGDVIFEQHWHTPKAPDRTTVYRATRNQLAMAKEALEK